MVYEIMVNLSIPPRAAAQLFDCPQFALAGTPPSQPVKKVRDDSCTSLARRAQIRQALAATCPMAKCLPRSADVWMA